MVIADTVEYDTKAGVTPKFELADIAPSIALQIEIRVECRGAKMGYGKLQ